MAGNASMAWRALAWAVSNPEEIEEVDEPPDNHSEQTKAQQFRRTTVPRPAEQTSLLTKAIMGEPETEGREEHYSARDLGRRRSLASNISLASTADLTSDTGLTSPARSSTPSPPIPEAIGLQLRGALPRHKESLNNRAPQIAADGNPKPEARPEIAPRKRSIQFACTAKPLTQQPAGRPAPVTNATTQEPAPRRPCIKFACPTRPASTQNTPPRPTGSSRPSPKAKKPESPSTPRKASSISAGPPTPRAAGHSRKLSRSAGSRPKFLRADSTDMATDGSQFHEFACEKTREQDWLRNNSPAPKAKLTIDDTLTKENHIRRLGKEAEEEAEAEEDEEEAVIDGIDDVDDDEDDEDEDEDDEDDEDDDEDEDEDDEDDYDALSDGYHTDEETGFASSDESDGEDNNMVLWTLSKSPTVRPKANIPLVRRSSVHDPQSDSSTTTTSSPRRSNVQRIKPQAEPLDLPDSTDFVCGTLDEDRPLEEAYLTNLAARRNEKLRVIPQDIDPSFPASEPEDEEDEDIYNPVHHDSDDGTFFQGRMEDIHHGQDRSRRRRKSINGSPRKYHSPPPKRHASPAPKPKATKQRHPSPAPKAKGRGRSPKPDRHHSPRRAKSPAPKAMATPKGSPRPGAHVKFNMAARPDPTATKSLPKAGVLFGRKPCRPRQNQDSDVHLRGAIDIVKGLEKKRQRRKEKCYQKYCNRARRGQIPERKPQPGRGAERMKELGLLMAGKKDQGNYVISI